MSEPDTITIRFEVHEGDVTQERWPTPQVGILEVLEVDLIEGQWIVTDPDAQPEWHWEGRSDWRLLAILDYLRARLGIPRPGEETRDEKAI